jgi:hypothetical protein
MPRFDKTYCSQCGGEFGSGDSGFSHCDQHVGLTNWDEISPAVRKAMELFMMKLDDRRKRENAPLPN